MRVNTFVNTPEMPTTHFALINVENCLTKVTRADAIARSRPGYFAR
jgi:hypothetical protein